MADEMELVIQADREAAANLWGTLRHCQWAEFQDEWLRDGTGDSGPLVQAFARHRSAWRPDHLHHRVIMSSVKLGSWLSSALDDPNVCEEMKADIREWFSAGEPVVGWASNISTQSQRITELEDALREAKDALDANDRLFNAVLAAIETGRNEPLMIIRDSLRSVLSKGEDTPTLHDGGQ